MVIGREKVDNYLLAVPQEEPVTEEDRVYTVGRDGKRWSSKGHLIDTTYNGGRWVEV